jgi:hypothetical protein
MALIPTTIKLVKYVLKIDLLKYVQQDFKKLEVGDELDSSFNMTTCFVTGRIWTWPTHLEWLLDANMLMG